MALIARTDSVQLPNNAPEWTGTPNPTWQEGVGGSYEMADDVFDQEGDTLTFTLNSGSAALPTGVSISGSTLVGSTSVVEGITSGVIIDVKDADSGLIASASFFIVASEASPETSPTLFDDYGSNAFAGEAGALAVNDAWASTVYDYFPANAPTMGVIPTPTTGSALPTSNAVNPNADNEYCAFDRAGLVTAINDATYRYVFLAGGNDFTNGSDNDQLDLTLSGESGTERWFVYWDEDTPANVQDIKPWNQLQGTRANVPRIALDSSSHTRFVGLSWGEIGGQVMRCTIATGTASNNIWYRCNMENALNHSWNMNSSNTNNNIVYQCVSHDHDGNGLPDDDIHAFIVNSGTNHKIISCEGWDILGDFFQVANGVTNGGVVEDCDIYRKTFYDGNGNIDVNGIYGKGEGGLDFKNINPDGTSRFKVYGNRIWGMRLVDETAHTPGGGSGAPIQFSNNSVAKNGVDVRWNVIFDSDDSGIKMAGGNLTGGDHSIVRNILSDIRDIGSNRPPLYLSPLTTEEYLNTVTDSLGADSVLKYYRSNSTNIDEHDSIGNFYQDTGAIGDQARWGTDFKRGYNAHAGTYVVASKGYGSNYEAPSKAALNMGDFTFKRKKMTGVENFTISGIVPTSSTPSGFRTLVPTSGGDQIGTSSGLGVDDVS